MDTLEETIFGSECSHWLEEHRVFCGAPAAWLELDPITEAPINVLCTTHRAGVSMPIPASARRAAPSKYTAVATHKR